MTDSKSAASELLAMIQNDQFDETQAERLVKHVDLNHPIKGTSFLSEAVEIQNVAAVRFLFSHGADPNIVEPDFPLWNLQYLWNDNWKSQYEIMKLFFQHGADPNLTLPDDDESLFDYVTFKVYNDSDSGASLINLMLFYKLLIVYGGGKENGIYPKPELGNIDLEKVDQYMVDLIPDEDNYHLHGVLQDENGNPIGEL